MSDFRYLVVRRNANLKVPILKSHYFEPFLSSVHHLDVFVRVSYFVSVALKILSGS